MSHNFHRLRKAKLRDIPDILELSEAFLQTTSFKDFGFDYTRSYKTMVEYLNKPETESILIVSVDADDLVRGVIGGAFSHHHFAPVTTAQEYVFCGLDSVALIKAFEQWANFVKADYVIISTVRTDEAERLQAIYENRGWVHVETTLMKELR